MADIILAVKNFGRKYECVMSKSLPLKKDDYESNKKEANCIFTAIK